MSKHFEVGTPMPLGHRRHTVNAEQVDASLERIAGKVAEMIAPTIAEAVKEPQAQGVATNAGSNGRKMPPQDQWDTLPDGDDAPVTGGDDFDSLPD